MEDQKKRKLEKAGNGGELTPSEEQLRLLLDPLRKDQLVDLLIRLGSQYATIEEEIKSIASADPVHCKLFVRGLSWETSSETLCAAFSVYGEIDEGAVIVDKMTGKSRGYGFITYRHMESARRALREPGKLIDGRLAVCNLACEGLNSASLSADLAWRKLYIGGLSPDISTEYLLKLFSRHGEIEEGSVAYDKETNNSRGFGFVTYKTVEAARRALDDSNLILGGRNITVKLADSQRSRAAMQQAAVAAAMAPLGMALQAGFPQAMNGMIPDTHSYSPFALGLPTFPTTYPSSPSGYPTLPQGSFGHGAGGSRKDKAGFLDSGGAAGVTGYSYFASKS